ncbi:hypothetical protein D3C72_1022380 [compost metagenome]
MVAVGEDLGLVRQVGAARIDQVDAGQIVLLGDFLRPQVLLHRHGEVGAALHRGVVGDDHDLAARDAPDAADHACAGGFIPIHAVGGQLADLEEGRAGVQKALDPVARQELAARHMALAAGVRAAARGLGDLIEKFVPQGAIVRIQRFESRTVAIDGGNQLGHAQGLGGFRLGGKRPLSCRTDSGLNHPHGC